MIGITNKSKGCPPLVTITPFGTNLQSMSKETKIPITIAPGSTPQVRVVFMGTPKFGAAILSGLIEAKYHIVGVVTRPDRPVGRDQTTEKSPVKLLAETHELPLIQPERLDAEALKQLKNWKPDLIVVAAYGRILPESLLELPGFGCVNVHTSLLPRWRGASPIQNALLAGDTETGVTIMLLDKGMDTGDIIAKRSLSIDPHERADTLTEKLTDLGTTLLLETLPLWVKRKVTATPQPNEGVTLCQLIEREDGRVFWDMSATEIYNRFRGLYPWPGLFTFWQRGEDDLVRIKLHDIEFQKLNPGSERKIGEVFEIGEDIGVQTGEGVILLKTVQLEGKTATPIRQLLQGNPTFIGSLLVS